VREVPRHPAPIPAHGIHQENTMVRRVLLIALVIAATASAVWAAESATFLLANGQRHSGYIIYGRGNNNIVDLQFHVNVSGNDVAIPMNQVVAIDFAGGDPSRAELDGLPGSGNVGVMVMRNGSTVRGHLHNIIGNDNVQWVNESGQRLDYPIRDVSRLYLSPAAARSLYNAAASQNQAGGNSGQRPRVGTGGQGQSGGSARQRQGLGTARQRQPGGAAGDQGGDRIRVPGNQDWVDTGFDVRRGDRLAFEVRGTITVRLGNEAVGPEGTTAARGSRYPLRNAPLGALIGAIDNGAPFFIGSNTQPITMPASGRLMLGINDDGLDDNGGAFVVTIIWR
jgi:hypothetical protein